MTPSSRSVPTPTAPIHHARRPEPGRETRGWLAALLALAAVLLWGGYVLAPVTEHTAAYAWDSGQGPRVLPLSPYRPAELTADIDCAAPARLTTVRASEQELSVPALKLAYADGRLTVRSDSTDLSVATPGCRTLSVRTDTEALTVSADGQVLETRAGDHRPTINGFYDPAGTLRVSLLADTQWDTSPTGLKTGLGLAGVACFLAALALARSAYRPRGRLGRPTRARPGPVDASVVALLLVGMVIGSQTADDGFITQIAHTVDTSGFIGNYVRWNNAPEAPFGWHYWVYAQLTSVSLHPLWLRIPMLVYGIAGWWLVRILLRRLLGAMPLDVLVGVGALYVLFWLGYGNTLRPEPLFALGAAGVLVLIQNALARRSVLILAVAAVIAGLTVGVGPVGAFAVAPFLAYLRPLARWLLPGPARGTAGWALIVAGGAFVALLAFGDQSLAAVRQSNEARVVFGPDIRPFWEDWVRWERTLRSAMGRQFPVWVCLLAAVVVFWQRRRIRSRHAAAVCVTAFALLPVLAAAPTKYPHHFGGLMILGPVLFGCLLTVLPRTRLLSVLASAGVVLALAAAIRQRNDWWRLSNLGLLWSTMQPRVGPVRLWWLAVLAVPVVAVLVWRWWRPGDRAARIRKLTAVVVAAFTLFHFANFAQAMVRRHDQYTFGGSNLTRLAGGKPCVLERTLRAQTGPGESVPLADLMRTGMLVSDWDLAFYAPCVDYAVASHGRVETPRYALVRYSTAPWLAAGGGAFAPARNYSTVRRYPIVVPGDSNAIYADLSLLELTPPYPDLGGPSEIRDVPRMSWRRTPAIP